MKYIKLRNTSLELSNICLGGANFGAGLSEQQTFEILDAYTEAGGNFVDTANIYGRWAEVRTNHSEITIGKWMKSRNARSKIIVATKGAHHAVNTPPNMYRVNKTEVQKDLDESLKTLGLDRIDLYWLHRDNPTIPVEEIIDFMEAFVKAGKIRYYGASNYRLNRMKDADTYCKKNNLQGFSAIQNQWSLASVPPGNNNPASDLVAMNEEFYQWHKQTKTPSIPYSATASGFFEKMFSVNPKIENGAFVSPDDETELSKKVNKAYINERNLRIYGDLLKLKEKHNVSLYTLSVACLINQPFDVIPISGVKNVEQLKGFLQASDIVIKENLFEKYRCQ